MRTPVQAWGGIAQDDRMWIVGTIVAPIFVWWLYKGRKRYSTKGLK